MSTSLVLASGGIDSLTAAALVKQQGHTVRLLHIDYGQITFQTEQWLLSQSAEALGFEAPISLPVPQLARWGAGSLVGQKGEGHASEWFPHRNLFLIATGVVVAASLGAHSLVSGIIDAAHATYPDCREPFLSNCAQTIQALTPAIQFINPLAHLTKREVVRLALELQVPLGLTFSCNTRRDRHCWRCIGCEERKDAFLENGIAL